MFLVFSMGFYFMVNAQDASIDFSFVSNTTLTSSTIVNCLNEPVTITVTTSVNHGPHSNPMNLLVPSVTGTDPTQAIDISLNFNPPVSNLSLAILDLDFNSGGVPETIDNFSPALDAISQYQTDAIVLFDGSMLNPPNNIENAGAWAHYYQNNISSVSFTYNREGVGFGLLFSGLSFDCPCGINADFNVMDSEICNGQSISFEDLSVSDANIISWDWDFGDGGQDTIQNPIHAYDSIGVYDVELAIDNGECVDTISSVISVIDPPTISIEQDLAMCPGEMGFLTAVGAPNYLWNTGSDSSIINYLGSTDTLHYSVTGSNYCGIDFAEVFISPLEVKAVEAGEPMSIYEGEEAQLFAEGDGPFTWSGENLSCYNCANPNVSPTESGYYVLSSEDAGNCASKDSIYIIVEKPLLIYVPNCFTPDGDYLNNLFGPVINEDEFLEYKFEVFDRDGHIVFSASEASLKWNGSYRRTDNYYVTDGIYVWRLNLKVEHSAETVNLNGTVLVVR